MSRKAFNFSPDGEIEGLFLCSVRMNADKKRISPGTRDCIPPGRRTWSTDMLRMKHAMQSRVHAQKGVEL